MSLQPTLNPALPEPSPQLLRTCRLATLAILVLALAWRLLRYALDMPVWGDEAFLGLNLMDRTFLGMLQPLNYTQVAPILFLLAEWLMQHFLGTSEYALRLLPLLAGLAAVALFYRWSRLLLAPLPATIALGFYALGYYTVRHSVEIKPYAFDQLAALAFFLPASMWLLRPEKSRPLWTLALLTPFALAGSYPAVFVAGGIALALLPALYRRASMNAWLAYGLFAALLLGTFLAIFYTVGGGQYDQTSTFMREYWKESFPPHNPLSALVWLIDVHAGNMFAYPVGGNHGGSAATLLLAIAGLIVFIRSRRGPLLILLLAPFALTFIAAALQRYPYGGSARVAQHLAPAICVLAGQGCFWLITTFARQWDRQALAALVAVLLIIGLIGLIRDIAKPYKTLPDQQARAFITQGLQSAAPAAQITVLQPRRKVPVNFQWYLRASHRYIIWPDAEESTLRPSSPATLLLFNFDPALNLAARESQLSHLPPGGKILQQETVHLQIGPVQEGPAFAQRLLWSRFPASSAPTP